MDNLNLHIGIKGNKSQIVQLKDTAKEYGSGLIEVFATPAMIALMENTCLNSISSHLPSELSTVGTKININHTKATPKGMKVTCTSELIEIDRKRLVFKVMASDEENIIGEGIHERFIIDKAKFMDKFK